VFTAVIPLAIASNGINLYNIFNFYINMRSGLDVNKNVNSQINLTFVGAFHPK